MFGRSILTARYPRYQSAVRDTGMEVGKLSPFGDGKDDADPEAYMEGDALVIDCRGCTLLPVPGSDECIRCMVDSMCRTGNASRVILRTGRDTEVSGGSGKAVREAASLKRWALPPKEPRGRCSRCRLSRKVLVETAWSEFPRKGTYMALSFDDSDVPAGEGCSECVRRTRRVLEQMDRRMDSLLDGMGSP